MTVETRNGARSRGAAPRTSNRRPQSTRPLTSSARFRDGYPLTASQIESALGQADCRQLARAIDPYGFVVADAEVTFRCPVCDRKQARAVSAWRWRCGDCDQQGAWLALRQVVALDVEACCRLAEIVHGIEVGRPVRDVA